MIYTTGHINYGGRVTDDWDRVCLIAILKKYYNDQVISDDRYKLSESGIYIIPEDGPIDIYRQYLDSLPNFEDPEVFGMHENANITFQTQESNKMIEPILSVQPKIQSGGGGDGKTTDQIVEELAQSLEQQLPEIIQKIN